MLLAVIVHPAHVQDRDGAEPLLRQARRLFPFVERIIGDAGYQGPKMVLLPPKDRAGQVVRMARMNCLGDLYRRAR
jgi:hypothetical protein